MDEREQECKFNKAMEYEREGKLLHAIQIYQSLLTTENYRRDSSMQLHKIYDSMGHTDYSSRVLKDYLEDFPDDFELGKYYSLFLIKHERYEEAISLLSSIPAEKLPEVKFLSGIASYYMKEYETAASYLADFLEKNKASEYSYDAYIYLAKTYLEINNAEKALDAAKGADRIFSNNEELQLLFAKIYLLKGMQFHALDSVSKGLKLNKESHQMNELAGRISYELGEYDKAENHLNKLIADADQSDEVYTLLGLIYLKKGEYNKADEMFSKALELNADNKSAIENKKICTDNLNKQNILQ